MKTSEATYRIVALDDHPMVLEGIGHILKATPHSDFHPVTSSAQLQTLLDDGSRFDLFILDLELPDADGFDVLKTIRRHCPDAAILIYTMHEEPWVLARLACLDIQGVVSKGQPVGKLTEAVATIREGSTYYNQAFLEQLQIVMEKGGSTDLTPNASFQLSERELQVLRCISRGLSNKETAAELFISTNTVGTYRLRLMRKFDAHNVAQLIAKGRRFLEE